MISAGQRVCRPPTRWWRAVSVLALLAGLLAMHGLAPGGGLPGPSGPHAGNHTHHHARPAASHAQAQARPAAHAQARSAAPHALSGATYARTSGQDGSGPAADVARAHARAHACADDGHDGGGHPRHADATCASGAVAGGPALPAPVPGPVAAVADAEAVRTGPAEAPDGARSPPSLAELQLLRI